MLLADHRTHRPVDGSSPYERWLDLRDSGKLEVCWLDHQSPSSQLLRLAEEMRRAAASGVHNHEFGATDSLILACAVLCRSCKILFTTDGVMRSPALTRLRRRNGRAALELRDTLR
jgi:hypothetical protein